MPKIKTRRLLLLAGFVWMLAGINILTIGIISYANIDHALYPYGAIGTVLVFLVFHLFIFNKLIKKNSKRIYDIKEESSSVVRFLDTKGYIVMAFMMTLGICLRQFNLVPEWFISFFYTGLGAVLIVSGMAFFIRFARNSR